MYGTSYKYVCLTQQGIIDEKKINHIGQGDHDVSNIFNGVLTTRGVIDFGN